jgi:REP element-mobilizing transposase RayT
LNEPNIAKIVTSAFRYFDGSKYELHAYCVMSNHVHVLLKAHKDETGDCFLISKIIQYFAKTELRQAPVQSANTKIENCSLSLVLLELIKNLR